VIYCCSQQGDHIGECKPGSRPPLRGKGRFEQIANQDFLGQNLGALLDENATHPSDLGDIILNRYHLDLIAFSLKLLGFVSANVQSGWS
jgi:hypothetical protein